MQNSMKDITGITVCHNTIFLVAAAVESVRKFHPGMPLIIVDGSDEQDPCRAYVRSLASPLTTVFTAQGNIGHGRGMDFAIRKCKTRFALIFDSDIVMIKSPVKQMLEMIEPDTYGVGYLEKTGLDGFEYGAHSYHKEQGYMLMLHPFFHLLQISEYYKFHIYVHHGAPCYLTALDIHKKGLDTKIIKQFPGLGHTAGKGWSWVPVPPEWIIHNTAGTRNDRKRKGKSEIEGAWVYEQDRSIRHRTINPRVRPGRI
jgi:hypothetical protein